MHNFHTFLLILLITIALTSATRCRPYSSFRVDCNTCFCNSVGDRYSCSRKLCHAPVDGFEFINDEAIDDNQITDDKDDKKMKYDTVNYDNGNWNLDDLNVPVENDGIEDERFIQDVSVEDQDTEDIGGLPFNFRFKRNARK